MNNLFKKSIQKYQKARDLICELKKHSDQIRTKSKKAIALLRRDNLRESREVIEETENIFKTANKLIQKNSDLVNAGFYKEAVEEYLEAKIFFNFLGPTDQKIPVFIKAKPEEIIGGFCDFTGELVRKAITLAGSKNSGKILGYKEAIEKVIEELTKIGLEGRLRQKYDDVERNLRKIEDILYDLRVRSNA